MFGAGIEGAGNIVETTAEYWRGPDWPAIFEPAPARRTVCRARSGTARAIRSNPGSSFAPPVLPDISGVRTQRHPTLNLTS